MAKQAFLTGATRLADRGQDPTARLRDLFVRRAFEAHLEFVRPVAAVHQMRVAVDEARRDPATFAIGGFRAGAGGHASRGSGIDDSVATGDYRPVLDHAQARASGRERSEARVMPDAKWSSVGRIQAHER